MQIIHKSAPLSVSGIFVSFSGCLLKNSVFKGKDGDEREREYKLSFLPRLMEGRPPEPRNEK